MCAQNVISGTGLSALAVQEEKEPTLMIFFFFLKQDKSNMELCFDCDVAVVYNRKSVVTMQLVSVINGDFHIITGPRIVKKNVCDVFPLSTQ